MLKLYTRAHAACVASATRKDDRGAVAVEYALLIGLVALVVVGALAVFKNKVAAFVNGVNFRA